ncbi:hypothetical protein [Streptomyces benahoarensis]|uniref:4-hydroxy-3-methylbut-2-enyl diphosphate reductase n=1 Tax=Streptomyces benahoarensis TaxID=2595054 RepID=A0A553ZRI8_9ACTN|nr:hypothetical protein [Streptomyces benahoarensis]TSB31144.1 hypothetical protein FNJ62_07450 [Streptomyces benahoarensis]TSB44089.1 hypothetical protein FNZ23_00910 [Streptomyces benahoarensis]
MANGAIRCADALGVTSGASAPELLVDQVLDRPVERGLTAREIVVAAEEPRRLYGTAAGQT